MPAIRGVKTGPVAASIGALKTTLIAPPPSKPAISPSAPLKIHASAVGRAPTIDSTIEIARNLPRSRGPEGKERLLTTRDVARLRALPATDGLAPLLAELSSPFARGLLLRAVLARSGVTPELRAFVDQLKTMTEAEMQTRATVLDLDSTTGVNPLDPLPLSARRGILAAPDRTNHRTDNDGLFQKHTASCGPTIVQMMLAEADPIAAFAIHAGGMLSDASDSPVAEFQKKLLEEHGGVAVGRHEAQIRARARNAIGRSAKTGDARALRAHVDGKQPSSAAVERAMKAIPSLPSPEEIARLTAQKQPLNDAGWDVEKLIAALESHVTPLTGARYEATSSFARGQAWRHLGDVAKAVRRGLDVPFGISEPAHWMLITAVSGKKPAREFLVSDPESGRTAWVAERSMISGKFVREQFGLCTAQQRGYVDVFVLPR